MQILLYVSLLLFIYLFIYYISVTVQPIEIFTNNSQPTVDIQPTNADVNFTISLRKIVEYDVDKNNVSGFDMQNLNYSVEHSVLLGSSSNVTVYSTTLEN